MVGEGIHPCSKAAMRAYYQLQSPLYIFIRIICQENQSFS